MKRCLVSLSTIGVNSLSMSIKLLSIHSSFGQLIYPFCLKVNLSLKCCDHFHGSQGSENYFLEINSSFCGIRIVFLLDMIRKPREASCALPHIWYFFGSNSPSHHSFRHILSPRAEQVSQSLSLLKKKKNKHRSATRSH